MVHGFTISRTMTITADGSSRKKELDKVSVLKSNIPFLQQVSYSNGNDPCHIEPEALHAMKDPAEKITDTCQCLTTCFFYAIWKLQQPLLHILICAFTLWYIPYTNTQVRDSGHKKLQVHFIEQSLNSTHINCIT